MLLFGSSLHPKYSFVFRSSTSYKKCIFFLLFLRQQMRLRALILFIPLAAFLTETVSFPMHITTRCKTTVCMKMSEVNCPHKEKASDKKPEKCNESQACSICPVCSIFIFQSQYYLSIHKDIQPQNYQQLNRGYISSYTSEIWKPPNNYLLFV